RSILVGGTALRRRNGACGEERSIARDLWNVPAGGNCFRPRQLKNFSFADKNVRQEFRRSKPMSDPPLVAEMLERTERQGPITIGLAGAGQMGTDIVVQVPLMPGLRIGAIAE